MSLTLGSLLSGFTDFFVGREVCKFLHKDDGSIGSIATVVARARVPLRSKHSFARERAAAKLISFVFELLRLS
jgi:hypothetical protein